MTMTSKEAREFLGLPAPYEKHLYVNRVDSLQPNRNTLMFLNHAGYDIKSLDRWSTECIILVDKSMYPDLVSVNHNDFILVDNPKFSFCKLVDHFNLCSVFQFFDQPDKIGYNCKIDPGVIVGGEDFSPVMGKDRSEIIQFPQMGGVEIGNNVTIKYNSMIGKGTFWYTSIGDNTMIDFGCQIGHNCVIGKSCIIAAGTIIGGSTTIGDNTTIGIGAKIRNGLKIGDNVSIGMGSVVIHDVPDNCVVVGNPAHIIEHKSIFDEKGLV